MPLCYAFSVMVFRAWIGLNAADALLTWLAFSMGAVEANTILSVFASSLGSEGMLLVKILFAVAVGGILWNRRKARVLNPPELGHGGGDNL